jgi:hypothetical protein
MRRISSSRAASAWLDRSLSDSRPPPSFRGGVTLVTIDVTVLDREGRRVSDLTAADFQVRLNGRVQPVRALSYLEALSGTADSVLKPQAPVMPQMFPVAAVAGEAAAPGTEPRVFMILVDDLSFPPLGGKALFFAAGRFVASLPPADLVGFSTTSAPGSVNPTTDRAVISTALAKAVGEDNDPRAIDRGGPSAGSSAKGAADQALGISQALDIDRGDMTVLRKRSRGNASTASGAFLPASLSSNSSFPASAPQTSRLRPDARRYRLRLAVADAAGRVSVVDAPVCAELTTMGP